MAVTIGVGTGGIFVGTGLTVTADTTLTSGFNYLTVGPTTIASGVTLTINSGVNYVVI